MFWLHAPKPENIFLSFSSYFSFSFHFLSCSFIFQNIQAINLNYHSLSFFVVSSCFILLLFFNEHWRLKIFCYIYIYPKYIYIYPVITYQIDSNKRQLFLLNQISLNQLVNQISARKKNKKKTWHLFGFARATSGRGAHRAHLKNPSAEKKKRVEMQSVSCYFSCFSFKRCGNGDLKILAFQVEICIFQHGEQLQKLLIFWGTDSPLGSSPAGLGACEVARLDMPCYKGSQPPHWPHRLEMECSHRVQDLRTKETSQCHNSCAPGFWIVFWVFFSFFQALIILIPSILSHYKYYKQQKKLQHIQACGKRTWRGWRTLCTAFGFWRTWLCSVNGMREAAWISVLASSTTVPLALWGGYLQIRWCTCVLVVAVACVQRYWRHGVTYWQIWQRAQALLWIYSHVRRHSQIRLTQMIFVGQSNLGIILVAATSGMEAHPVGGVWASGHVWNGLWGASKVPWSLPSTQDRRIGATIRPLVNLNEGVANTYIDTHTLTKGIPRDLLNFVRIQFI